MLWPNPARRDKPWNYIPPEFQRYTKLILATGNLYGHVENAWGIPFPKEIKWKEGFLGKIFQEYWEMTTKLTAVDYKSIGYKTKWLQDDINHKLTATDCKLLTWWLTANDYKTDWQQIWLQAGCKLTASSLNYKMTSSWPQMTTKQIDHRSDFKLAANWLQVDHKWLQKWIDYKSNFKLTANWLTPND